MSALPPPVPKLGKSTLSMYLRTDCDRELYFSLFKATGAKLPDYGMPAPLSARPNIELVTSEGVEFEHAEMTELVQVMDPAHVRKNFSAKKIFDPLEMLPALTTVAVPGFMIQPELKPDAFRISLLVDDFGMDPADARLVPMLAGMRPDVIIVRPSAGLSWEVLPTGKRRRLAATEMRSALSVVDVKNTMEGNKSYAAEVVLYSIMLAKWLDASALDERFFVSDECFLWTHGENSALAALTPGSTMKQKLDALVAALERIEFAVIAPSVVHFFKEDIPRVTKQGLAGGWKSIDFHVGRKCSNCDWLGYERWLSAGDRVFFDKNPDWYCKPSAASCDHLSQIPNLSRGARRTLADHGIDTLTVLSGTPKGAPALHAHSLLRKERSQIPAKARAILTNTTSTDASAVLAGLASYLDLEISLAVNFDSASGLLTGIAMRATLWMPFGSTPSFRRLEDWAAPVEFQTSAAESSVVYAFFSTLERVVREAQKQLSGALGPLPRTQIYFWEHRQFEELCVAVGRHLPMLIKPIKKGFPGGLIAGLSWLFPPEELIEADGPMSPHIVFIGDLAQRVLRLPTPHAFTLRSTHENYGLRTLAPRYLDSYFIDPMGNGIPRERIFEVWKNTGMLRRGGKVVTKAQASADYMDALKQQSLGIASVAAQLRTDFKTHLKGSATRLSMGFSKASKVAFDSKLWIQWARVEEDASRTERNTTFTLPAEALEATYEALVLETVLTQLTPTRAVYRISKDSAEAKLDDQGKYFVMGSVASPGFPLETPASLGLIPHFTFGSAYRMPLRSLIRGVIHGLNRETFEADVEFMPRFGSAVFTALVADGLLPLSGQSFLMDGLGPRSAGNTENILKAIGDPKGASPDQAALDAMASAGPTKAGTDPATPASNVLWQAPMLSSAAPRSLAAATALAARAEALSGQLDASQKQAIAGLAQRRLALIWGPPGTGKTSTITAYLLAVIEEAAGRPRRILLTGPNYRTVEVLTEKLQRELNKHPALGCSLYRVYSKSRPRVDFPEGFAAHITGGSVNVGVDDVLLQAAWISDGVAIFATSAHTVAGLVAAATLSVDTIVEAFDLAIIDESSQAPLNLCLPTLASLTEDFELLIAGDMKQMPPIQALEPPVGAEYIVGSLHMYLHKRFHVKEEQLLVNYRSADHLVEFAKTLGYPAGLRADVPLRRIQLLPGTPTWPTHLLPQSPAWDELLDPAKVTAVLLYDDIQSSQANVFEARVVAALAWLLRQRAASELAPTINPPALFTDDKFLEHGLGVVTPHKAQRALVIAEFTKLFSRVPRETIRQAVDTVERFQGGERHTIIVSFGVGDVDVIQGEEGFLLQMERANVAISRAMVKCIVIMPKSLAYHLPSDAKLAKTAAALKSYVEEFCNERKTVSTPAMLPLELRWHTP